ncbi:MAG: phosphate ABC transporter permease PstA, partial [Gammaproteobacteria bacterium]
MTHGIREWYRSGEPYIWLNAGAVSLSVIMVAGLVLLIAMHGLGHFWPKSIMEFEYTEEDGTVARVLGELADSESVARARVPAGDPRIPQDVLLVERSLIKTGNRDLLGQDFRWVLDAGMSRPSYHEDATAIERREWGNFYGYLVAVKQAGANVAGIDDLWQAAQKEIRQTADIFNEIRHIEKVLIGGINYKMERLRLREKGLELEGVSDPSLFNAVREERNALQGQYQELTGRLADLYEQLNRSSLVARVADGQEVEIPVSKVVRAYRPNDMSMPDKLGFYFLKLWEFMSDDPREANTEGGIFPAIFGTVMMVLIMAVLVTPFGVVAAVYLREYAKQDTWTRLIRIAVNNLAGVPSVVYGVFGLGFFVYFIGGGIDEIFFREALPNPTFGTPGIMWASLTLAILTVPVVIVATEEGLSRVPREIREGSLALGATKAETLWRTVLPMTASAMMTGLILAIARAAGEVAPLMLVGVVKLAPSLPMDA